MIRWSPHLLTDQNPESSSAVGPVYRTVQILYVSLHVCVDLLLLPVDRAGEEGVKLSPCASDVPVVEWSCCSAAMAGTSPHTCHVFHFYPIYHFHLYSGVQMLTRSHILLCEKYWHPSALYSRDWAGGFVEVLREKFWVSVCSQYVNTILNVFRFSVPPYSLCSLSCILPQGLFLIGVWSRDLIGGHFLTRSTFNTLAPLLNRGV